MKTTERPPLLCFSHLRWGFVWQRPQQLMSRFARHRRVFFIEEPVFCADADDAQSANFELRPDGGVTVCQPVCRDPGPAGGPQLDAMYARLIPRLVRDERITDYTVWFYTPMLLSAADRLAPSLLVYDAMDELALFKDAPAELLPRERRLLRLADVVFTGGVSLGRAKAALHHNVHALPSGVDVDHYRQALDAQTRVPADLDALPRPRIGFFGVIDERADLPLLASMAAARPKWSFAMLGPVVKIEPAALPSSPNIHYLGKKNYKDLPGYLKGFDVCMMPFALSSATRFISPTKTLEYMAAHKPIVSTPVPDVVSLYRDVVRVVGSSAGFVAEIEQALAEGPEARAARIARERAILMGNTWDSIVARMDEQMEAARVKQPWPLGRPQRAAAAA